MRSSTYCLTLILQKMTELDYENLIEYQRYENLVNTKEFVSEKDYKFIIGYDPLEKENWVKESWHYEEGERYINLKLYYQKLKK